MLRLLLFIPFLVIAVAFMRLVAGFIAVKCGHPKAYAWQILASGGICLITEPKRREAIPVSKKDERRAAAEVPQPGKRSRPSGLARCVPTRLDERD